jgi:hypothetical protein
MALLVLLIPADRGQSFLGAKAIEALSRLGVTTVSVARDEESVAVVLEGWAFDGPSRQAATDAIGAAGTGARTLQPVMQMAVAGSSAARGLAAERSGRALVVDHEAEVSPR